jgi:hypothetical protein
MPQPEQTVEPGKPGSRETTGKIDRYVRIVIGVTVLGLPLCVGLLRVIVYFLAVKFG